MDEENKNPDQEALDWLTNWLLQRQDVVEEPMRKLGYSSYEYIPMQIRVASSANIVPFNYNEPLGVKGTHNGKTHSVAYRYSDTPITKRIHERAHALFDGPEFGGSNIKPQLIQIEKLNPVKHQDRSFLTWLDEMNDGWRDYRDFQYWPKYYNNPTELYSRLMELRQANNIDPKKIWTKEEIKQLRNNKNLKDFNIFERYDDDFILKLFNEIADNGQQNNQYNNISYAKRGTKLIPKKKRWL